MDALGADDGLHQLPVYRMVRPSMVRLGCGRIEIRSGRARWRRDGEKARASSLRERDGGDMVYLLPSVSLYLAALSSSASPQTSANELTLLSNPFHDDFERLFSSRRVGRQGESDGNVDGEAHPGRVTGFDTENVVVKNKFLNNSCFK